MVSKEKACLNCARIHGEEKCPECNETPSTDSFKGKVHIFDSEKSQIANKMGVKKTGEFAIKTK